MSIFRLRPLDLGHPSWDASTLKGECVVRAPSKQDARMLATLDIRFLSGGLLTSFIFERISSNTKPLATKLREVAPAKSAATFAAVAAPKMQTARASGPRASWLATALRELEEAPAEASEMGWPSPGEGLLLSARQLLRSLEVEGLPPPAVYPNEAGDIEIAFGRSGRSVLLLIETSGAAVCFASIDGRNRRARYQDMNDLPDAFVRQQLAYLKEANG
jgi:hypothetical protein